MDLKTFKKAEELVKRIEEYKRVADAVKLPEHDLDWMKFQVNTQNSDEGKDIDITLFSTCEGNAGVIKAMIEVLSSHFKKLLEEAELELEEL